jgi:hypothetical protein
VIQRYLDERRGVYLVVNGHGFSIKDVKDCRALFYEHDTISKEISINLWRELRLPEPSFQLDTGGKSIHTYWVLKERVEPSEWLKVQVALIKFAQGDKTLKKANQLMRLAGGLHQDTQQHSFII